MNEKIYLEQLYQETDRAEQEREKDAARGRIIIERQTSSLEYDLEPNSSSFPTTTLTSQNKRPYQEDKAGSHRIKIQCPPTDLEGKEILEEVVQILAMQTDKNIPGSTLVLSMSWIEDARWLREGAHVAHVLTANLGDSRAMIFRTNCESTYEAITRLTCEHTLSRQHELQHLGVTVKEVSEKEAHIYSGDTLIGRQLTNKNGGVHFYPYMDTEVGLAMTRSLGDARLHHSPLFSRIPSISLVSYEIQEQQEMYLITISDGITGAMTDEEVAEVMMTGDDKTYTEAAKAIAKKAKTRGAQDNLSVVISGLHNILPGEVILQFVADGHGGAETSQFIADNIERTFRYVMEKRAVKQNPQAYSNFNYAEGAEPNQKKSCQSNQLAPQLGKN